MGTLVIGDIHGCYAALLALAQAVGEQPGDHWVVLGDFVDRGPDSRRVVEWLIDLDRRTSCTVIRGNHEVMMRACHAQCADLDSWLSCGGDTTLESYGVGPNPKDWATHVPEAHWQLIDSTVPFWETDTHIFVHACVDATKDMADQSPLSLYWKFCDGMRPHKSGKPVICGHTIQESGIPGCYDFGVCLETGVAYGLWLTCLELETGHYWQANQAGETREGQLAVSAR